jgi:hypothetical protein
MPTIFLPSFGYKMGSLSNDISICHCASSQTIRVQLPHDFVSQHLEKQIWHRQVTYHVPLVEYIHHLVSTKDVKGMHINKFVKILPTWNWYISHIKKIVNIKVLHKQKKFPNLGHICIQKPNCIKKNYQWNITQYGNVANISPKLEQPPKIAR